MPAGGEGGDAVLWARPTRRTRPTYDARLAKFLDSVKPIDAKVAAPLRRYCEDVPVTATEPVFGYMSDAIGFDDAQPCASRLRR